MRASCPRIGLFNPTSAQEHAMHAMTEAPVSPLRRRMIDDMTPRKFAPRTQEGYIRAVKSFSAFLGASPDTASFEDARRYQLHLVSSGAGVPTINHTLTALRFLFMVTLRKPAVVIHLPFVREPRRLPVVFRRLFLEKLVVAHDAGRLQFFGDHTQLAKRHSFTAYLAPLRKIEWVVYSKRPFGGPEAVLAYLSLYTHRIAISNSRLVAFDDTGVTFKWKDYRAPGRERAKLMTLAIDEFIRRFLIHVLPGGFHRIRHYGLLANGGRAENIARARRLLNASAPQVEHSDAGGAEQQSLSHPCPCCGGRMIVIETFARGGTSRYRP